MNMRITSDLTKTIEGAVAQSVERAALGQEVVGSFPAQGASSLLVGRCQYKCDRLRQKSWYYV